jgi:hypothetical protein
MGLTLMVMFEIFYVCEAVNASFVDDEEEDMADFEESGHFKDDGEDVEPIQFGRPSTFASESDLTSPKVFGTLDTHRYYPTNPLNDRQIERNRLNSSNGIAITTESKLVSVR